jgi:hypothetical protein
MFIMKSVVVSFVLFVAACQASFTIPTDQADGVWSIKKDSAGNHVGEPEFLGHLNRTARLPTQSATRSAKFARGLLPNPSISCSGYGINGNDFDCAWAGFDNWIGGGYNVNWDSDIWTTCGSAIAYMCNYAGTQPAVASEYDESITLENDGCGANTAAWVHINDWNKAYGRDNAGARVCF